MLFYVETNIVPGKVAKVVFSAAVNVEGRLVWRNFKDMLASSKILSELANFGDRANITIPEGQAGTSLPYVVLPEMYTEGAINFTAIAQQVFSSRESIEPLAEKLLTVFAKQRWDIYFKSVDDVVRIFTDYKLLVSFRKGEGLVKVEAPELLLSDPSQEIGRLREYNGRLGHQFKYITPAVNKTQTMEIETDPFFIKLPAYEKLRSDDFPMSSLLPNMFEVAKPYPHPVYNTPFGRKILETGRTQMARTLEEVSAFVPLTPEQKQTVPKIELQTLIGSPENDTLGIQENEEEFFLALVEYIKYDIKQSKPDEDVEELFLRGVCSSAMLIFLQELLKIVTRLNWMHTGKFPIDRSISSYNEDDDWDSDRAESDGEEGVDPNVFISIGDSEEMSTNGHEIIQYFVDDAVSNGAGLQAYVEAIIKIARWGSVKPRMLSLEKYPSYLDLNSLVIRSSLGTMDSTKPRKLEGGYDLEFSKLVLFNEIYRDTEYKNSLGIQLQRTSLPVGIEAIKYFSGGTRQFVYLSFFDLYSEYVSGKNDKLVKGISWDGDKFIVTIPEDTLNDNLTRLDVTQDAVNRDVDKQFVNFTSTAAKTLVVDYGGKNVTNMSALSEALYSTNMGKMYNLLKFSSHEEFVSKLSTNPMPSTAYVSVNLAGCILPVFFKAADMYGDGYDKFELEHALEAYVKAVKELGFVSELDFLRKKEEPVVPTNQGLQSSTVFGEEPKETVTTEQGSVPQVATEKPVLTQPSEFLEEVLELLVRPVQSGESISALQHSGVTFCGLTIRTLPDGSKINILSEASKVPAGAKVSPSTFKQVEVLFVDALFKLTQKESIRKNIKIAFDTPDVLKALRGTLQVIAREGN